MPHEERDPFFTMAVLFSLSRSARACTTADTMTVSVPNTVPFWDLECKHLLEDMAWVRYHLT